MIRRAPRPTTNYTVISNGVLLDERLSYRARGLLTAILARPDNWTVRSEALARQGVEGRDAIRTALKELREAGYIHTWKGRNADGSFRTEQVVFETPMTQDNAKPLLTPETDNQAPDNQAPDNQAPDNQAPGIQAPLQGLSVSNEEQVIRTSNENNENTDAHASVSDRLPAVSGFAAFWSLYPRKIGKGAALKRWKSMKPEQRANALRAIPDHVAHWRQQRIETQFVPHPATWLSQGRWDDELAAEARGPSMPTAVHRAAEMYRQARDSEQMAELEYRE